LCGVASKYPKLPLKETCVRRFKNLYKDASGNPDQQEASNKPDDDANEKADEDVKSKPEPIKELPQKKQADHFFFQTN